MKNFKDHDFTYMFLLLFGVIIFAMIFAVLITIIPNGAKF